MVKFESILFPVDFSDRCVLAASQVRLWAQHFGIPVRAIHATLSGAVAAEAHLREWAAEHLAGIAVGFTVAMSPPAAAIVAEAHKSRLIMMPTHGQGPFRQMLVGSVTAKVLHDAPCPVWTAAHAATARPLRREKAPVSIVCGVDRTAQAPELVRWARDLADRFDAELTIVHAIPAMDDASNNRGERAVRAYWLDRTAKELKKLGVRDAILRGGPVADTIAAVAREQTAGLAIIGRGHATKRLGRLRTHSLSIVAKSPCPVISV